MTTACATWSLRKAALTFIPRSPDRKACVNEAKQAHAADLVSEYQTLLASDTTQQWEMNAWTKRARQLIKATATDTRRDIACKLSDILLSS